MSYQIAPEDLDAMQALLDANDTDGLERYVHTLNELRNLRALAQRPPPNPPIENATLTSVSPQLGESAICAYCGRNIYQSNQMWLHTDTRGVMCHGLGSVATPP